MNFDARKTVAPCLGKGQDVVKRARDRRRIDREAKGPAGLQEPVNHGPNNAPIPGCRLNGYPGSHFLGAHVASQIENAVD